MLSLPMTWVKEGGMVRLDRKYLQTDFKGVGTDHIVYTILASDVPPKHGMISVASLSFRTADRASACVLLCR